MACFLNVCHFLLHPPCSELSHIKFAMDNLMDGQIWFAVREQALRIFSVRKYVGPLLLFFFFFCNCRLFLFSSFETVFGWAKGVALLLPLSSEQSKSCYPLMVACEETVDHMTFTKSVLIFNALLQVLVSQNCRRVHSVRWGNTPFSVKVRTVGLDDVT